MMNGNLNKQMTEVSLRSENIREVSKGHLKEFFKPINDPV